jgi:hypothetical protein
MINVTTIHISSTGLQVHFEVSPREGAEEEDLIKLAEKTCDGIAKNPRI